MRTDIGLIVHNQCQLLAVHHWGHRGYAHTVNYPFGIIASALLSLTTATTTSPLGTSNKDGSMTVVATGEGKQFGKKVSASKRTRLTNRDVRVGKLRIDPTIAWRIPCESLASPVCESWLFSSWVGRAQATSTSIWLSMVCSPRSRLITPLYLNHGKSPAICGRTSGGYLFWIYH